MPRCAGRPDQRPCAALLARRRWAWCAGTAACRLGLRSGGTVAIIFSLVCIGIAAFSFLIDFDAADQMVRAGAPDKAAWGIALGLTVTLVWLYLEILRLLSYLQND